MRGNPDGADGSLCLGEFQSHSKKDRCVSKDRMRRAVVVSGRLVETCLMSLQQSHRWPESTHPRQMRRPVHQRGKTSPQALKERKATKPSRMNCSQQPHCFMQPCDVLPVDTATPQKDTNPIGIHIPSQKVRLDPPDTCITVSPITVPEVRYDWIQGGGEVGQ